MKATTKTTVKTNIYKQIVKDLNKDLKKQYAKTGWHFVESDRTYFTVDIDNEGKASILFGNFFMVHETQGYELDGFDDYYLWKQSEYGGFEFTKAYVQTMYNEMSEQMSEIKFATTKERKSKSLTTDYKKVVKDLNSDLKKQYDNTNWFGYENDRTYFTLETQIENVIMFGNFYIHAESQDRDIFEDGISNTIKLKSFVKDLFNMVNEGLSTIKFDVQIPNKIKKAA